MKRREFLALVGGIAVSPVAAQAQNEPMRRVAFLSPLIASDAEGKARVAAFLEALQQAGWSSGRNVQVDVRWAGNSAADIRKHAAELVAVAPDVIVAGGSAAVPLLQATRTIPVVFVNVIDPEGAGIIESLARPGSNATGFTQFEYSMSGKWLELLKELAPQLSRAAVLRDNTVPSGLGQFAAIQSVAPTVRMEVRPINMSSRAEIERAVAAFASVPNGGLITTAGRASALYRDLILELAVRHRLPTVFHQKFYVDQGGLLSYGPDLYDQHRRAAGYVDRILKGEKPADLPVQAPTKYQLVLNLKTAKALGIAMPPTLLARADTVIE